MTLGVAVECGRCGGPVYMVTCNAFNATGHDWTLVSLCRDCRLVNWVEGGCEDCRAIREEHR
jgi:hypothetical protein